MSVEEASPITDLRTVAVYQEPEPHSQSVSYPIYMSSNFQYAGDIYDDIVSGERHDANIYGRCGNPTEFQLEAQMTKVEAADESLAVASGMAAISVTLFSLLHSGDHLIMDWTTYSSTHELVLQKFPYWDIDATFVDTSKPEEVEAAFRPNTKLVYFESIANPTMKVTDIARISEIAHRHNAVAVCDNTFASPVVVQPLRFGADIVLESASKFICGHNDALGGTIAVSYKSGLLPEGWIEKTRWGTVTKFGPALSPFNSWLLLRGIQTLPLRVTAQTQTAGKLAAFLEAHPMVDTVWYPGLESHPQYEVAAKQFSLPGAMLSFCLKSEEEAVAVLKSFKLIAFAASLGGVRSVAQCPASMAFLDLPPEERNRMGIRDGIVRISAGLESPDDLIAELGAALDALPRASA